LIASARFCSLVSDDLVSRIHLAHRNNGITLGLGLRPFVFGNVGCRRFLIFSMLR
jgi:hypothetical protein